MCGSIKPVKEEVKKVETTDLPSTLNPDHMDRETFIAYLNFLEPDESEFIDYINRVALRRTDSYSTFSVDRNIIWMEHGDYPIDKFSDLHRSAIRTDNWKTFVATLATPASVAYPEDGKGMTYQQFLTYLRYTHSDAAATVEAIYEVGKTAYMRKAPIKEGNFNLDSLNDMFSWDSVPFPTSEFKEDFNPWYGIYKLMTDFDNYKKFLSSKAVAEIPISSFPEDGRGMSFDQFLQYMASFDKGAAEYLRTAYVDGSPIVISDRVKSGNTFSYDSIIDMITWRRTAYPDPNNGGYSESNYRFWSDLYDKMTNRSNYTSFLEAGKAKALSLPDQKSEKKTRFDALVNPNVKPPAFGFKMNLDQWLSYLYWIDPAAAKYIHYLALYPLAGSIIHTKELFDVQSVTNMLTWTEITASLRSAGFTSVDRDMFADLHHAASNGVKFEEYKNASANAAIEEQKVLYRNVLDKMYMRSAMLPTNRRELFEAVDNGSFSVVVTGSEANNGNEFVGDKYTILTLTVNGRPYTGVASRNLKDKYRSDVANVIAFRRAVRQYMHENSLSY